MKPIIRTTLLLLALLLPTTATAHNFEVDGIFYNIIHGNNATVTYKGTFYYEYSNEYSGDVTIPSTVTYNGTTYSVTSIGEYAFAYCSGLSSVTIPNSISSIGDLAFYNCSGLTSVTIPNSVTSIGEYAFAYCSGLSSVTIPNSVTSIGYNAFEGTPWYNNQPDGLVYAGLVAYKYKGTMPEGTSITIRQGTLGIANNAFSGCTGLTSVTIPNSVTTIGYRAFNGCSGLSSVTIPNSVTTIGNNAFYNCSGLTSVTIPNSVTSIGECAFAYCSGLSSVTIPNSVTTIGRYAFYGTPWYENQPDGLVYAGLVAYKYKGTMPSNTSITIRAGTLGIADLAFSGCSGLTSVTIPNSVTSIGSDALYDCSGLTCIVVDSGNPKYDSRNNCNAIIEAASNTLVIGCKNTTIPNSVTSIGDCAFYACSGLMSVTIPNSVTSIGEYAFAYCSGLSSVTIPNSVTTIGFGTFSYCNGLTSVTIPNSVTSIGDYAFAECFDLTSVTIPNSVTSIGFGTFSYCNGLTSVTIGNSVTSIDYGAFEGCTGLTEIYCLALVPPTISSGTFSSCYSATLFVPESSVDSYKSANYWKEFSNIVAISAVPGDVDGDGNITIGDVADLIDLLLHGGASITDYPGADMDGDGSITIADVSDLIDLLLRH